jgi:hypothetical protein
VFGALLRKFMVDLYSLKSDMDGNIEYYKTVEGQLLSNYIFINRIAGITGSGLATAGFLFFSARSAFFQAKYEASQEALKAAQETAKSAQETAQMAEEKARLAQATAKTWESNYKTLEKTPFDINNPQHKKIVDQEIAKAIKDLKDL